MSRKGCSSDNAACEGFFGRIKNEMFYGRDWAGITLEKFICFLDRYIRWYNEKRIKLSLGAMSPVKYSAASWDHNITVQGKHPQPLIDISIEPLQYMLLQA